MKYFDQQIMVKEDNELLRFIEGFELDPIIGEQAVEDPTSSPVEEEFPTFSPQISPHTCSPKIPHNEL